MSNHKKANKGYFAQRRLVYLIVLLLIFPFRAEGIRKGSPCKPVKTNIRLSVSIKQLPFIPPEMIDPTMIVNPYDTHYHACDKMPVPLRSITKNIYYNNISKDPTMYGTVIIHALISEYGEVEKCIVAKEIYNSRLVEQLVNSIRHTRFEPARRDGFAVKVWIGIPVRFKLSDKIVMN